MALKIINLVVLMCVGSVISTTYQNACCPKGYEFFRRKTAMCVDVNTNWTMPLDFTCEDKPMVVINEKNSKFTVNDNGQLVILLKNREDKVFEPKTFCVDYNVEYERRVAVLCRKQRGERSMNEDVCRYCMIVSSLFLMATAVIYATRRELRDLHGMSIINFCGSSAIWFGILAAMNLVPYSDMNLCAVRGYIAYFFLLVSFFWMNALSIQILLNMRHHYSISAYNYGEKGFVWYALYAWGCPAALTVLVVVVNVMPGEHLKPGVGLDTCWFFDKKQQWIYMYSVMTVLIAVNICIFIYTTILLWSKSNTIEDLKCKFLTTVRLFIVMGVLWIAEMLSTLLPRNWVWDLLDIVNTLQGVLVFLALCAPLLPCWRKRTNESVGVQNNVNIQIDPPYKKFDC